MGGGRASGPGLARRRLQGARRRSQPAVHASVPNTWDPPSRSPFPPPPHLDLLLEHLVGVEAHEARDVVILGDGGGVYEMTTGVRGVG
jgi:hypothetical protein